MGCKEEIIKCIGNEKLSCYEIHKRISYSNSTTHRYCRELFFQGKLKAKKEISGHFIKTLYYIEK